MESKPSTPPPFQDNRPDLQQPSEPKGNNRKVLIICAALLSLVLVGVIIFLFVRSKKIDGIFGDDLKVTPADATVSADGGMASFTVEGSGEWKLLNAPKSWGSVAIDENTIYWEASENFSGERSDTLKVGLGDKTCSIILKQESGAFYADPTSQLVSAGSNTVYYTIIGQNNWNVAVGPEGWGSVSREGNRLRWSVTQNFGGEREDAIQLQSDNKLLTLTLTQEAALMAEKTNIKANGSGGTYRVEISGPHDWTCGTNQGWIEVDREEDKVCIKVDENDWGDPRDGIVNIYSGSQKVEIKIEQKKKSSGVYYSFPMYPTYPMW